ncbi:hypothetical protein SS50377_26911 [Spironucleus salmonicida]|uniref:Uncharacterized protein n=1 Tax=Spironucleus salmonicida TaxID=348837 RepID=V6LRY9_9EUKA|nr:hypothetical protein SS50377_26911 [Spironucleus salmonicida]|eukprot:EST47422.1 Hypothetical protein SS50377_12407 [Spironucleus salmonicida]
MRSIYLSAAQNLPDESSEEQELKCQPILQHTFEDLLYAIETLENTASAELEPALTLFSSACHINHQTRFFNSFSQEQVKNIANILTTVYVKSTFKVLSLKAILNSTAVLPTSLIFNAQEGFKLALNSSLYSTDLKEIQYALVTIYNIIIDIGPTKSLLFQTYLNLEILYDNAYSLFSSTEKYARRVCKEMIDLVDFLNFDIEKFLRFLLNNLVETERFGKEILQFLGNLLKKFDKKFEKSSILVQKWLVTNYGIILSLYTNDKTLFSFLTLIYIFLQRGNALLRQDFYVQNEIISDLTRLKLKTDRMKEISISIIYELFTCFPSCFEIQNVPKYNIFQFLLSAVTSENIEQVCNIMNSKIEEILRDFDEIFIQLLAVFTNLLSRNNTFLEGSIDEGSSYHRAGETFLCLLVEIVEYTQKFQHKIQESDTLVNWLERMQLVDTECSFNVNIIIGQ